MRCWLGSSNSKSLPNQQRWQYKSVEGMPNFAAHFSTTFFFFDHVLLKWKYAESALLAGFYYYVRWCVCVGREILATHNMPIQRVLSSPVHSCPPSSPAATATRQKAVVLFAVVAVFMVTNAPRCGMATLTQHGSAALLLPYTERKKEEVSNLQARLLDPRCDNNNNKKKNAFCDFFLRLFLATQVLLRHRGDRALGPVEPGGGG